jgi:hypothetical protein
MSDCLLERHATTAQGNRHISNNDDAVSLSHWDQMQVSWPPDLLTQLLSTDQQTHYTVKHYLNQA